MDTRKTNINIQSSPEVRWTQYYVLTGHWKADIEFYCEDLRFLHHMVDKYLLWITKSENLNKAKNIEKDLFNLKESCDTILTNIKDHLNELARLVDNPLAGGDALAIQSHGELEKSMARFVKRFRETRRQVFKITEYILDSEELPVKSA